MSANPSVLSTYPHWYVRYALIQTILDRLSLIYDARFEVQKTGYTPDLLIRQWPAQQSQAYYPDGTSFSVVESFLPEYGKTKNAMPLLCAYFLILNKWQSRGWILPGFACPEEGNPVSPSNFGTESVRRFPQYHGKPITPEFGSYYFGNNAQYYWDADDLVFYHPTPTRRGVLLQTPNLSYYVTAASKILNYSGGLVAAPHAPLDYSTSDDLFYQRTDLYCTAVFTETTTCTWQDEGTTRSETTEDIVDSKQSNIVRVSQTAGKWENSSKEYSSDWKMEFSIVSVSPFRYKTVVFLWTALMSGDAANSNVPFQTADDLHAVYHSQVIYESGWQTGNFSNTISFNSIANGPCRYRIALAQVIVQPEYPDRFTAVKNSTFSPITSRT